MVNEYADRLLDERISNVSRSGGFLKQAIGKTKTP
jgi:hypothetical protein